MRPIHSVTCRVYGIGHLLDGLSSVWAGPFARQLIGYIGDDQNLKFRDPFYDNREFTNSYLSRLYGNKKQVVGVDIGNGLFD